MMWTNVRQRVMLIAALCFISSYSVQGKESVEVKSVNENSDDGVGPTKTALHTNGGDATTQNDKINRVFDFKITPEMKTSDLDDPKSSLSKLIAFIVKGAKSASEYVSVETRGRTPELKIQIKDDSIFVPGGNPANAQHGFRRTDVNPAINPNTTLTGTTTFYQTIRLDAKAPLVLKHGYLLASIEIPTGDHIWDIFTGSDFESSNTAGKESSNAHTIRVRDLTTKTLFDMPLSFNTSFNFAVMVDWTANTLTVFASTGKDPLKKVAGPAKNDPKAISPAAAKKGEYHLQLIKFPLPDPKIPEAKRSDVPHVGIQEKIIQEHVFFSNVYITSGTEIEQPRLGGKKRKHSRCKA